jgi:hypothetical protein
MTLFFSVYNVETHSDKGTIMLRVGVGVSSLPGSGTPRCPSTLTLAQIILPTVPGVVVFC